MPFKDTPIRVSGSDVGNEELSAINDVFERGYLGMGADVHEFEELLSAFFGRPAVCVATGTAALQLSVQCAGIGPGDEVLVPSLTYVAAFQAISASGATPVSVDVLPHSLTLDPAHARDRISERTKAVMPVHYGGGIHELTAIYALAREYGLRVIEDAAHAFGSSLEGQRVGTFGDITCFSFDPIKNLTSGEGGCVVSADLSFLDRVRDARLLGVKGDSKARSSERRLYEYAVENQGWRYHMSNINAAIGKAQFSKFPYFADVRQRLARAYDSVFTSVESVEVLPNSYAEVVPHIYVIRLPSRQARDNTREQLFSKYGVETAIHWYPNHLLKLFCEPELRLPVTEDAFERMLTLPLHTKLTEATVCEIAEHVIRLNR